MPVRTVYRPNLNRKRHFLPPSKGVNNYTLDLSGSIASSGSLIKDSQRTLDSTTSIVGIIIKSIIKILTSQTNLTIVQSSDDAHETSAGVVNITASDLALNGVSTWMGLRFQNVPVPLGATIISAVLSVNVTTTITDDPATDIHLEDIDNSPTFTTAANDISSRALTTAFTNWTATGVGTGVKVAGDIASAVQEVVDRPGWMYNNSISVIFKGLTDAVFVIRSFNSNPSNAATLLITYTPTGIVTSSGSILNQPSKLFLGTISIAGDIVNLITRALSVDGTIGSSGSIVKDLFKNLSGSIASSGIVNFFLSRLLSGTIDNSGVVLNQPNKSFSGIVSSSGSLSRLIDKLLSSSIAVVGTITNSISKLLSGSIDSEGDLTSIKLIPLSLDGSIPSSGSLLKLIVRTLLGSVSSQGSLIKSIQRDLTGTVTSESEVTNLQIFTLNIEGAVTSSGIILKSVGKLVSGTISSSGILINQISSMLEGTIAVTGIVLKMSTRNLSGSIASSSSLDTLKSFLLTLNADISSSGSISRNISKLTSGTIAVSGTIIKSTSRNLSGIITSTSNLIRTFTHVLSGTVGTVGNPDTGNVLLTTGTISSSGNLTKSAGKLLGGVLTPVGSANKFFSQVFSGNIAISGILQTAIVGLQVVQTIGRAMFRGMFRKMR